MFKPASLVAAALSLASTFTHAALDNKGTEFIIPFLPNAQGTATTLQLHLTSETATTVQVDYPVNTPTFSTSVAVTPGNITVVDIPLTADDWTPGAVANNAAIASSSREFVAYTVNLQYQSSDAALALPVDTMNTRYIVASYPAVFSSYGYFSQMMAHAAYDNTVVTITPSTNVTGHPAGIPFTVTLNRGEAYYLEGSTNGATGDLSGTLIEASRPIGLINGNECTQIPNGYTACDHIYEFAQPVQTWGSAILAANLPNRSGSVYRIFASENNTSITRNGISLGTINRGQFIDTGVIAGSHEFTGSNPIYVVQYMPGQNYPGSSSGDPAMGNMIPYAQYLNNYTFSTVGGSQFATQYLTLIAANSDLGSVLLDGVAVPAASFSPISGTGYSSAVLRLAEGVHTTSSPNGHGITVEGYNSYDSFIYPGGALFQFINPKGDPFNPVCSADADGAGAFNGGVTDNHPSEDANNNGVLDAGEDANGNNIIDADTGVFFVELINSTNASLSVDAFTPGDGQVSFVISRPDTNQPGSATVQATDGAGNTCTVDVAFEDEVEPLPCDLDADQDVDRNDVNLIRAARNTVASPNDPRDTDKDGMITLNDARMCVVQCTRTNCNP